MECSVLKLGGVLSRNLSSQRNIFRCETPLQLQSFNLLVTWPTSPWTLSHSKLQSCICVGKADISEIWQRSYSQIQSLWSYWQRLPMESVSVPFKKQTFAMSVYIDLRCSSFFSTLRCNFSNSMMWELLTNAECWFSDYSSTEITLLFSLFPFFRFKFIHSPVWFFLSPLTHCWNLFLATTSANC